jgi:endonuclease YncB( thermonuclease family)
MRIVFSTVLITALSATSVAAQTDVSSRATVFSGPYVAEVVRVIDGDTIEVSVALWPGLRAEYAVRVAGIDAPELLRPDCEDERQWAERAQAQAASLYSVGLEVRLENVRYDSFAGRVIADVRRFRSDRWLQFSDEMLERQMAVEWHPGQDTVAWCLLAQENGAPGT